MSGFAQRKFDHDEARRRYAAGETKAGIARDFGVTRTAVLRVVSPGYRAKQEVRLAEYYERNRVPCEGCGTPCLLPHIGGKKKHSDGRALCGRCRADEMIERIRFDENADIVAVRCCLRDCANGERWQPPENFSRGAKFRDLRPGGIHGLCRTCQTRARQQYRLARRVPCSGCGTLVLHERRRRDKPPECRSCAMKRVNRERRERHGTHTAKTH